MATHNTDIAAKKPFLRWAKSQILAGVMILAAPTVHAGPDATTNYLMNTPATLMDFGLYMLSSHIRSLFGKGFAVYDWDTNEIRILVFELLTHEDQAKQVCEDVISDIRVAANVRDGTTANETSSFSDFFSHDGFVKGGKEQHTERMMDLDKKFRIVCITPLETYEAPVVGTGYSLRVRSD